MRFLVDTAGRGGYSLIMNGGDGRRLVRGDKMFSKANETATHFGFNLDQSSAGEARWFTTDGIAGVSLDTAEDFDADGERIERATFTVLDRDGFPVEKHETADDAFASADAMAKRTRSAER